MSAQCAARPGDTISLLMISDRDVEDGSGVSNMACGGQKYPSGP